MRRRRVRANGERGRAGDTQTTTAGRPLAPRSPQHDRPSIDVTAPFAPRAGLPPCTRLEGDPPDRPSLQLGEHGIRHCGSAEVVRQKLAAEKKLPITSSRKVAEWGSVFGDPVVATAILDRLLHHSRVLTIRGDNYRLRAKLRNGLLAPKATAKSTTRKQQPERGQF